MKWKAKRTFKERLAYLNSQANSFRVSAAIGNENTILTAVEVYDTILKDDYGAVIDQSLSRNAAWKLAANVQNPLHGSSRLISIFTF